MPAGDAPSAVAPPPFKRHAGINEITHPVGIETSLDELLHGRPRLQSLPRRGFVVGRNRITEQLGPAVVFLLCTGLSRHLGHNPGSGRVMQKLGMTREGCFRQHAMKWGVLYDVEFYGILRAEWEA